MQPPRDSNSAWDFSYCRGATPVQSLIKGLGLTPSAYNLITISRFTFFSYRSSIFIKTLIISCCASLYKHFASRSSQTSILRMFTHRSLAKKPQIFTGTLTDIVAVHHIPSQKIQNLIHRKRHDALAGSAQPCDPSDAILLLLANP